MSELKGEESVPIENPEIVKVFTSSLVVENENLGEVRPAVMVGMMSRLVIDDEANSDVRRSAKTATVVVEESNQDQPGPLKATKAVSNKSDIVNSTNVPLPVNTTRRQSVNRVARPVPSNALGKLKVNLLDAHNLALKLQGLHGSSSAEQVSAKIYACLEFEKNESRTGYAKVYIGPGGANLPLNHLNQNNFNGNGSTDSLNSSSNNIAESSGNYVAVASTSAAGIASSATSNIKSMFKSSSNSSINRDNNNSSSSNSGNSTVKDKNNLKRRIGIFKSLSQSGLAAILGGVSAQSVFISKARSQEKLDGIPSSNASTPSPGDVELFYLFDNNSSDVNNTSNSSGGQLGANSAIGGSNSSLNNISSSNYNYSSNTSSSNSPMMAAKKSGGSVIAKQHSNSNFHSPLGLKSQPQTSNSGTSSPVQGSTTTNSRNGFETTFDVTRPEGDLVVSLWQRVDAAATNDGTDDSASVQQQLPSDHFLGFIKVALPKSQIVSDIVSYKLLPRNFKDKITGGVRLRLQFQPASSSTKRPLSLDDFTVLKLLGKGSFGKVVMARKKDTQRIYAIKILRKKDIIDREEVQHTMTERQVLMQVDSPFIVSLKFAFQSPSKLYLVMDFINGGELFFHLQKARSFTEDRARFYAAELTLALQHLHESHIVYRDLKPENVMLDSNGHVALADFGLCKTGVDKDNATTFCGTAEYLAPEILAGKKYGKAVDWWSLGTLIYELINGIPPYYNANTNLMYRNILTANLRLPSRMSPEAQSIVIQLLEKNPKKRLGCGPNGEEDIKNHPFFASIDWDKLMNKQITPPFIPKVTSEQDFSNFDPTFTKEKITLDDDEVPNAPAANATTVTALSNRFFKRNEINNALNNPNGLDDSVQQQFKGFSFDGDKESSILEASIANDQQ